MRLVVPSVNMQSTAGGRKLRSVFTISPEGAECR